MSSKQSSAQDSSSRTSDLKPPLMTLPDGRTLAYAIYGHTSNISNGIPPVFYFHGYPASHHEALLLDAAAKKHGIVLIAATRPGMGFSSPQQRRHLLDWPADVLSLAEHLNVGRFGVIGVSGGGPYVLACWQAIPRSRLVAASIVCGLYPTSLGLKGMLLAPRMLLTLAPLAPWLVAAGMNWGRLKAAAHDFEHPEKLEKLVDDEMKSRPEVDRAIYSRNEGGIRETMIESTREALCQGGDGPAWEAKLYGSEWGFYLDELQVAEGRLMMWHGELDTNVPVAMAEKAASQLKGAELTVVRGEGHCGVIVHKADDILAALKTKLVL